jgi:hypothetical protein
VEERTEGKAIVSLRFPPADRSDGPLQEPRMQIQPSDRFDLFAPIAPHRGRTTKRQRRSKYTLGCRVAQTVKDEYAEYLRGSGSVYTIRRCW